MCLYNACPTRYPPVILNSYQKWPILDRLLILTYWNLELLIFHGNVKLPEGMSTVHPFRQISHHCPQRPNMPPRNTASGIKPWACVPLHQVHASGLVGTTSVQKWSNLKDLQVCDPSGPDSAQNSGSQSIESISYDIVWYRIWPNLAQVSVPASEIARLKPQMGLPVAQSNLCGNPEDPLWHSSEVSVRWSAH